MNLEEENETKITNEENETSSHPQAWLRERYAKSDKKREKPK